MSCEIYIYVHVHVAINLLVLFYNNLSGATFVIDDYYDTEDPSVNLHEFIVNSMQVRTCTVYV